MVCAGLGGWLYSASTAWLSSSVGSVAAVVSAGWDPSDPQPVATTANAPSTSSRGDEGGGRTPESAGLSAGAPELPLAGIDHGCNYGVVFASSNVSVLLYAPGEQRVGRGDRLAKADRHRVSRCGAAVGQQRQR